MKRQPSTTKVLHHSCNDEDPTDMSSSFESEKHSEFSFALRNFMTNLLEYKDLPTSTSEGKMNFLNNKKKIPSLGHAVGKGKRRCSVDILADNARSSKVPEKQHHERPKHGESRWSTKNDVMSPHSPHRSSNRSLFVAMTRSSSKTSGKEQSTWMSRSMPTLPVSPYTSSTSSSSSSSGSSCGSSDHTKNDAPTSAAIFDSPAYNTKKMTSPHVTSDKTSITKFQPQSSTIQYSTGHSDHQKKNQLPSELPLSKDPRSQYRNRHSTADCGAVAAAAASAAVAIEMANKTTGDVKCGKTTLSENPALSQTLISAIERLSVHAALTLSRPDCQPQTEKRSSKGKIDSFPLENAVTKSATSDDTGTRVGSSLSSTGQKNGEQQDGKRIYHHDACAREEKNYQLAERRNQVADGHELSRAVISTIERLSMQAAIAISQAGTMSADSKKTKPADNGDGALMELIHPLRQMPTPTSSTPSSENVNKVRSKNSLSNADSGTTIKNGNINLSQSKDKASVDTTAPKRKKKKPTSSRRSSKTLSEASDDSDLGDALISVIERLSIKAALELCDPPGHAPKQLHTKKEIAAKDTPRRQPCIQGFGSSSPAFSHKGSEDFGKKKLDPPGSFEYQAMVEQTPTKKKKKARNKRTSALTGDDVELATKRPSVKAAPATRRPGSMSDLRKPINEGKRLAGSKKSAKPHLLTHKEPRGATSPELTDTKRSRSRKLNVNVSILSRKTPISVLDSKEGKKNGMSRRRASDPALNSRTLKP